MEVTQSRKILQIESLTADYREPWPCVSYRGRAAQNMVEQRRVWNEEVGRELAIIPLERSAQKARLSIKQIRNEGGCMWKA